MKAQKKVKANKSKETLKHEEDVRNEGLTVTKTNLSDKNKNKEIDLEIEAPGSANEIAEQGAKTI